MEKEHKHAAIQDLIDQNVVAMRGGTAITKSFKAASIEVGQMTLNLN